VYKCEIELNQRLTLLTPLTQIKNAIAGWWAEFTLQTKLMAAATLVVSLVMSGLTFWAVNTIQLDARMNDTRFGSDLGLLLANNTAPLIAENDFSGVLPASVISFTPMEMEKFSLASLIHKQKFKILSLFSVVLSYRMITYPILIYRLFVNIKQLAEK
jgi:hypothetical protein